MRPHRPAARLAAAALVGAGAVLALSVALKLTVEAGGPLWLDEGWTLGIVDRRSWGAFVQQLRLDVNPPLYFLVLRGWTAVFGLSDAALRSLSTVAACALPLAALTPGAGRDGRERAVWAVLLALWTPGIAFAQEARGYALLTLLAAGQTALFAHLLARPGLGRAVAWTAACTLTALTQHHALLLVAVQGVVLVAVERGRVLRLWPAALAFLPALAWDLAQAPRILVFGRPEHAWYPPFTPAVGEGALGVMLGPWPPLYPAMLTVALAATVFARRAAPSEPPAERPHARADRALWLAAAASVAAGLALIGLGALRPSLTPRYLAPFAPGALLIPGLLLRGAGGRLRPVAAALIGMIAVAGALAAAASADTSGRRAYQMETASADLGRAGVRTVAFLWDNPTDGALAPVERTALADAFFVRARRPVAIVGVPAAPGRDPNPRLAAAAADGLVWLYDLRVPHTAARRFPPRPEAFDARLDCRRYAGGALGVVACVRSPLRWTR